MTTAAAPETEIKIMAEPGQNPATFRFVVDRPVLPGAGVRFADKAEAAGSPLPEALFALPEITSVQIGENVVTLTKEGPSEWLPIARQVGAAIRSHLRSGAALVSPAALEKQSAADADARKRIETVFESTINPAVAGHGGFVELVDFKNGIVYVKMSGGCQGCSSSMATLKYGIERMVREAYPELVDVVDVTDHTAGANPYFQ
jgi:Fe-S cluster biogenesis protein NfuA